jgi:hypothetical protein
MKSKFQWWLYKNMEFAASKSVKMKQEQNKKVNFKNKIKHIISLQAIYSSENLYLTNNLYINIYSS